MKDRRFTKEQLEAGSIWKSYRPTNVRTCKDCRCRTNTTWLGRCQRCHLEQVEEKEKAGRSAELRDFALEHASNSMPFSKEEIEEIVDAVLNEPAVTSKHSTEADLEQVSAKLAMKFATKGFKSSKAKQCVQEGVYEGGVVEGVYGDDG